MIHYHGGPISPNSCAFVAWRGRHAFVSWARPDQLALAAGITQSFALDNGAFTIWKRDGQAPDWNPYYDWTAEWLGHPACDWAVIPDVIGGTEEENDKLLTEWPHGLRGVPVWHLNESPERLQRLADDWPRVALGSAAEWDVRRPTMTLRRLAQVLPTITDEAGRPRYKLHGLRMLNPAITAHVPLASADSTNLAQNIGISQKWTGGYAPLTKEMRTAVLVERIEGVNAPAAMSDSWSHEQHPLDLFGDHDE